ncbi:MAG: hypothetical protein AVDCRST_MAG11-3373, partial [uncultured Gemmatimonadaceae bacterium]
WAAPAATSSSAPTRRSASPTRGWSAISGASTSSPRVADAVSAPPWCGPASVTSRLGAAGAPSSTPASSRVRSTNASGSSGLTSCPSCSTPGP